MSPKYELVKRYYDLNAWNVDRVRMAVDKEWITESEFFEITGISFSE